MSQHHPAPGTGGDPLLAKAELADRHPGLPGAYITTSQFTPTEAHVLLDGPADLEAWRQATHTDVRDVQLIKVDGEWKVVFTASVGPIVLRVYTVFAPASSAVTG